MPLRASRLSTLPQPAPSSELLARGLGSGSLYLVLLPTEQCNFRCTYCFEDFSLPRMGESVVAGIEAYLRRRVEQGLRSLGLSWFGGEPLLALETVLRVQRHALALAREAPRLRVAGGMTTNGYRLTPEVLRELVDCAVTDFQVSLDGPAAAHDLRRHRADGAPTFERIWRNVLAARDLDRHFELKIRVHVDRDNRSQVPELLSMLATELGGDPRFVVFVPAVSRLGGANDMALPVLSTEEEERVVAELRARASELGLRLAEAGDPVCYAGRANSFVIRANGELSKCSVALASPSNRVGRITSDGRLDLDQPAMRAWTRGLWTGDPETLECPLAGIEAVFPGRRESLVAISRRSGADPSAAAESVSRT